MLPLELSILDIGMLLQAAEGSFYGFSLAKTLSEAEGAPLAAHGTLYKALSRMTTAGLLEAKWEDPAIAEAASRPRRRLYTVTGAGERVGSHEHRRLVELARSAPAFGLGSV